MKPVPPEAPGQLAEREVKFKGSSGKAISTQHRAESYEPVTGVLLPVGSEPISKVPIPVKTNSSMALITNQFGFFFNFMSGWYLIS